MSTSFAADPVRSQRDFKLRPHLHLPEFDGSLYIDNSVLLTAPAERIIEKYNPDSGICIPLHASRTSVLDEFLQVVRLGRDDQNRVFEQLNHYLLSCPDVLKEKPYWGGILIRDHRNAKLQAALELWLAHVLRYSRRDQLSANYVFRDAGLSPDVWKSTVSPPGSTAGQRPKDAATIKAHARPPFLRHRRWRGSGTWNKRSSDWNPRTENCGIGPLNGFEGHSPPFSACSAKNPAERRRQPIAGPRSCRCRQYDALTTRSQKFPALALPLREKPPRRTGAPPGREHSRFPICA